MTALNVAAIFSDNMVLQRDKNIRIWGTGADGNTVTATINGDNADAQIRDGRWQIDLPPMAAGGPYTLNITDGGDSIAFDNVMIGEVWLAGGQSNMEFEIKDSDGGQELLGTLNDVNVRYYYTPKIAYIDDEFEQKERNSGWSEFSAENAKHWSAVAFHCAKKLSEELNVTVGIIGCNWGGTSASAWMSREAILKDSGTRIYIDEYDEAVSKHTMDEHRKMWDEYQEYSRIWNEKLGEIYSKNPDTSWEDALEYAGECKYPGPKSPFNEMRPTGLYETMISRVCPYTLRGFLYYQGESDDHRPEHYYDLFSALISEWRRDWGDEELPFLFVQLPMFAYENAPDTKHWAKIREAQLRVYNTIKNTYMALIPDFGTMNDIHPKVKKPVGDRLALLALNHVYGVDCESDAPELDRFYIKDDEIHLHFRKTYGGLTVKGDRVEGFEIAGDDGEFHKADCSIMGNEIRIKSDKISRPKFARYNWTNHGPVTIYNKAGIPLGGFRI